MAVSETIAQQPEPGERRVYFCGDTVVFRLTANAHQAGEAFVRTNLGQAQITRREIIRKAEKNEPRLARDWFDIPMQPISPGCFEATVGLHEVGHFEAKCLFIPQGERKPLWPPGPNTAINVEPAATCCGNIIYNAFVRQFGPNKFSGESGERVLEGDIAAFDQAGYTVIPPSGTFRDLIKALDFIFNHLGCRWLQLLPIHPTPTTYGRMGRFGSPYAALSFSEVDPALAEFDPKATPLEQFKELVEAVHARRGKILIDMAINHTGWAARLHASHPHWLMRSEQGEIQNPGAWGVVWEDLTHLDYRHKELWHYMADILLTWCHRGVDGFRCDAGYMIPVDAWQYMIAKVRDQYPNTIFFLEGLGGKISVTRELLNRANFNWAYSELFQNYDRSQIEHYLHEAYAISSSDGIAVNFAETHDNNRLASISPTYARLRTQLCALLAPNGAFAFANGVEWFATEKINVHDANGLNWDAPVNQTEEIAALSSIMKRHPAFGPNTRMTVIGKGEGNFIALLRHHRPSGEKALVLANLDWQSPITAHWQGDDCRWGTPEPVDLISGELTVITIDDGIQSTALAAGQVMCLVESAEPDAIRLNPYGEPEAVIEQRLKAKVIEVMVHYGAAIAPTVSNAALELARDPEAFCQAFNDRSDEPGVIVWNHPEDLNRHVMIPPHHFVLLKADHPFSVRIHGPKGVHASEESLQDTGGRAFILIKPFIVNKSIIHVDVNISIFAPERIHHSQATLVLLGTDRQPVVKTMFTRKACFDTPLLALDTNGRGAMLRVHSDWRRLNSRYDALLAANLNPNYPEDRRMLLARCRAWVVYQGYSQEINLSSIVWFGFDETRGAGWRHRVPTGQGEHVVLQITLRMDKAIANTTYLDLLRVRQTPGADQLADSEPVAVIIRPDIEDRDFHSTTKAYTGPEAQWPQVVEARGDGFRFSPLDGKGMTIHMPGSRFVTEPEWLYMVHRPLEAERGLDPDSDLFSPGYFSITLRGGEHLQMVASPQEVPVSPESVPPDVWHPADCGTMPLDTALEHALTHYVVKRGDFRTVIAGYPWFLDWGRDTLIVARGLVAAGQLDMVEKIVMQFARFENEGTLPNMIRGDDAGNRETSDAPLWLFTVCADLADALGSFDFLDHECDGRPLRSILIDMAKTMQIGLPNGVAMDPASGLIYSPAHFTWMDTNYPACTPRQGYPIEIQALWYAALKFLCKIDRSAHAMWTPLAQQVREAITTHFWNPQQGYLADCLHADPNQGAPRAQPDDALRPNQLLAITLGAITEQRMGASILRQCQRLLVPGAIRSLADKAVSVPLAIRHNGQLLNNPSAPYWGRYVGDEDTQRKPAYHNGTAWTWLFPSFSEAWVTIYGNASSDTALAWLTSSVGLINTHCIGHVPEILDGNAPHAQRGCDAQAWGASELLRVWRLLARRPIE